MSKIRLLHDKELLAALIVAMVAAVMLAINIGFIIPGVIDVFLNKPVPSSAEPINMQVVNEAIRVLNP